MTQLYINGQLCDLPTDFKITLVTENLYFSKASTYTYDIQLPMAPFSNNARIFGNINRFDKSLQTRSWPAQLIVDSRVIVNGTAVVVGITDTDISVQLLQGNSELNWKQRYEKTYINDLDLGTVAEFGLQRKTIGLDTQPTIVPNDNLATTLTGATIKVFKLSTLETYNQGKAVFSPIKNVETDTKMNNIRIVNGDVFLSRADEINIRRTDILYPDRVVAQPKFELIVNKIFAALGMTIVENELSAKALYKNLYLANSTSLWNIADMLPHLSVVEFIEQLQVMFNCVIEIHNDNTVIIKIRRNYYSNTASVQTTKIDNVIDEFEVDIDSEESESDSDKAKAYDISYEDFGKDFLGHEFDSVPIVGADELPTSPTINPNVFAIDAEGHKVSSPCVDNGAITGEKIDHYQIWPTDASEEFSLKFVPIYGEYITHSAYWVIDGNNHEKIEIYYNAPEALGMLTIEDDDRSVQDILDENETLPEKEFTDTICVGFAGLESVNLVGSISFDYLTSKHKIAETIPAGSDWDGDQTGINIYSQIYDLSLMPLEDGNGHKIKNLNEQFYTDTVKIVTSRTYAVKFATDKVLETMHQMLIKNQLFTCKQIKYTITARGFDKIAEGEFYKL